MKKKVILSATLSILLCLSLIVGSTFALFTGTDTVNVAVTAGKVAVSAAIDNLKTYSMENETTPVGTFENGGTAVFTDAKALVLDKVTPGDKATFDVTITNNSDVAASYRIRLYVEGALANALVATATIDGTDVALSTVESATDWAAFNGKESIVVPMSVLLPVEAGNENQGKSAKVIVVVEAVQGNGAGTILVDGKAYDNWTDAISAAGTNGTVQISGTVEMEGVAGTSQVTDLNGLTIEGLDFATLVFVNAAGSTETGTGTFSNMNLKNLTVVDETFYTGENGENAWEFTYLELGGTNTFTNVTFTDGILVEGDNSAFVDCSFIGHNNDSSAYGDVTMYGAWVNSGKASFTNCDFTGTRGLKVADQYTGSDVTEVTVDKCSFGPLFEKPGIAVDNRIGSLTLTIQNSTFMGTQPGDAAEGGKGVAYVYEDDNRTPDATTITLINNFYPVDVANDAELDAAIKAGNNVLKLGSGNYIIPDSAKGKTLTILGNGVDTVVATQDDGSYEGCDYSLDGAAVTFEGVTINTDSSTYTGYARLNATYNNCTINGTYTLYGDSVFNNCTFNVSGDVYNIWTWGAANAVFNDCTFNSDGKALLLYGTVDTNLTVNNCTFNDNGGLTDLKAAIEIGNDYDKAYTLTVNKTTVNGYEINDKGISTGSTLWANKNSMPKDKLHVVIDGVVVY